MLRNKWLSQAESWKSTFILNEVLSLNAQEYDTPT